MSIQYATRVKDATKHQSTRNQPDTEDPATGILAGIAIITCILLIIFAWADEAPPRVALVSADSVQVEGFGTYAIENLPKAEAFTSEERLHVMERTASHLKAYRMGYKDARGLQPTDQDMLWLSRIIYTEARGQGYRAQLYVAQVAINRLESSRYPDTMQGVALDDKQFSAFNDRSNGAFWRYVDLDTHDEWWRQSMRVAHAALMMPPDLRPLPENVMHFYSPGAMVPMYRVPDWAEGKEPTVDLGVKFKFYADIS